MGSSEPGGQTKRWRGAKRLAWEQRHPERFLDRAGAVGTGLSVIGAFGLLNYSACRMAWRADSDDLGAWLMMAGIVLAVGGLPWALDEAGLASAWSVARLWRRAVGVLVVAAGSSLAILAAWLLLNWLAGVVNAMSLRTIGFIIIGLLVLILVNQGRRS